jgi:hypothetical protein
LIDRSSFRCKPINQETTMSDTALRFARPTTFLSRLLAFIDQQLLVYAEAAIRNGDVLRCDM